jgi:hypothetical protein
VSTEEGGGQLSSDSDQARYTYLSTLSLNSKLYEQYSGIIWGLILIKTYIDKLRKAKKINKNFKVFE